MQARSQQLIFLGVALALLAMTFLNPTLPVERPHFRFIFTFDITQSMNVADTTLNDAPVSRLEFAKRRAVEAMAELPCGSEIGLALFAGHRVFLLATPIEICANYSELKTMISTVDWRMTWEFRSEIAKGIYKSLDLLEQLDDLTRVVFFTDGHEAPPINPDLPPRDPGHDEASTGLIVGVGNVVAVPIPKLDADGKIIGFWQAEDVLHVDSFTYSRLSDEAKAESTGTEHLSSLRESYLIDLADRTNLHYHRLQRAKNLVLALQSKAFGIPKVVATDMRWALALGALVAILGAMWGPLRQAR